MQAGGHFHFGAETRRRAHHRCSYVARQLYWYVASTSCDRAINSAPGAEHGVLQTSCLCEQFNTRAAPAVHSTSAYSAARCATALRESWRASVGQASHTRARAGAAAPDAAAPSRKPPRRRRHVTRPSPQATSDAAAAPATTMSEVFAARSRRPHKKRRTTTTPHNTGLGRRPLREAQARNYKRGRRQVLLLG